MDKSTSDDRFWVVVKDRKMQSYGYLPQIIRELDLSEGEVDYHTSLIARKRAVNDKGVLNFIPVDSDGKSIPPIETKEEYLLIANVVSELRKHVPAVAEPNKVKPRRRKTKAKVGKQSTKRAGMTRNERDEAWWAVYRGDDFLTHGTIGDIAIKLDMSINNVRYHTYQYQRERAANSVGRLLFVHVPCGAKE